MFDGLVNLILNPIVFYIVIAPLWAIFVMCPFLILKYVAIAVEMIATGLPKLLLFGSNDEFSWSNLPFMFLQFMIISVAIWLIFFVVVLLRYGFMSSEKAIENVKTAAKYSLLCWVYIFLIPVGLFGLYFILDWVLYLISGGDEFNIADEIFKAFKPVGVNEDQWNSIIHNNYFISKDIFNQMGGTTGMINVLLSTAFLVVVGIGMVVAYFFASYTVVGKIIEQFFLFICSPFVAVSSVLDGGKKMATLRDQLISRALIVFSLVIGAKVFASLASWITHNVNLITGLDPSKDFFVNLPNMIVIALVSIGGAFTFVNFGSLVGEYIGQGQNGPSIKDGVDSWKATKSTALGLAGLATGGMSLVSSGINRGKVIRARNNNQPVDTKSFVRGFGKKGQAKQDQYAAKVNKKQQEQEYKQNQAQNASAEAYGNDYSANYSSNKTHSDEFMDNYTGKRKYKYTDVNATSNMRRDYYADLEKVKQAHAKQIADLHKQQQSMTKQQYEAALNNINAARDKNVKDVQTYYKNQIDKINKSFNQSEKDKNQNKGGGK